MNNIQKFLSSLNSHEAFKQYYTEDVCQITGVPTQAFTGFFFNHVLNQPNKKNYCLLFSSEKDAQHVFDELKLFFASLPRLQESFQLLLFPSWGLLPYSYSKPDSEKEGLRAGVLSHLLSHSVQKKIVVTSIDSLLIRTPQPEVFKNTQILLKKNMEITMTSIYKFLEMYGYERVEIVEKPAHYTSKGGIIDIFCPAYFNPIRLDFFGDQLESLRFFDPLNQTSLEEISEWLLSPRRDLPFNKQTIETIFAHEEYQTMLKTLGNQAQKSPLAISEENDVISSDAGFWELYPLGMKTTSLFDYFEQSTVFVCRDYENILSRIEHFFEERNILFERSEKGITLKPEKLFISKDEFLAETNKMKKIEILSTPRTKDDFSLQLSDAPSFKGRVSQWVDYLKKTLSINQKIFLSVSSSAQKARINHILSAYNINSDELHFLETPLMEGLCWSNGTLFTEKEIFGRSVRGFRRISKNNTEVIKSFVDLSEGDNVVHVNYGIGKFIGLKRMQIRGFDRDFLELAYAGNDKLFIPLEQLELVHRYIGSTENPTLDYLGARSSWQKTREKVRGAIEKLAEELLTLYAKREKSRGVAFPPDSAFQEEFEAAFPYEETEDQISAITDIKKDMELARPMDRLICGDVGYGKTEVGIRVAFKSVMSGRQVAILCPTTILAFQHFHTFCDRFKDYPINIDFISRFRTSFEIKEIKKKIKMGGIDIIIGTHALLGKDIRYKNIGLLIIDEEQKFGVLHKEAIRKIRSNVDTITLTATPIPRTLQMSLVGIRDLSLIEIPPRNRKKVKTYVLSDNDHILKRAIRDEIERDGQVFVLHNKVRTIEMEADRIRKLCPKVSLAVLHGQMPEDNIENVVLDFYNKAYDILLCTTIIESGIDMPNVNTLIVLNAHMFGLSQLYQLKGRVGRSDRQAHAYLFYPSKAILTEIASKRLNTLQEYDELGAGFKVAMKDLEIRGAGNMLGKEQSGDIVAIGFELYIHMLREKLKSISPNEDESETSLMIPQSFYIPDEYIRDTRQKMEFYKKMSSVSDISTLRQLEKELRDRFGVLPQQMLNLLYTEEIKILVNDLKFDRIEWDTTKFSLMASSQTKISMEVFTEFVQNDQRIQLDPKDPRMILFSPYKKEIEHALYEMKEILKMW